MILQIYIAILQTMFSLQKNAITSNISSTSLCIFCFQITNCEVLSTFLSKSCQNISSSEVFLSNHSMLQNDSKASSIISTVGLIFICIKKLQTKKTRETKLINKFHVIFFCFSDIVFHFLCAHISIAARQRPALFTYYRGCSCYRQ